MTSHILVLSRRSGLCAAGFLQRMEAAALNIEEMTARLRDDPSLIIRGSE